jgi:uncharacterized membrane protein YccC
VSSARVTIAGPSARILGSAVRAWRPSDPGRFALRLAVRTGVVMPAAFALGLWVDEQAGLFAAFGTFALLLFVDFGGPMRVRVLAYAGLVLLGSALIPLGTVCGEHTVLATAAMLVVGFAILFAGVVNGYLAAGGTAALLTFVLPAMAPGSAADIAPRLAGWWIAAALCVPATLLLLPARPRDRLRAGVADVCRALSAEIRSSTPDDARRLRAAVEELSARFAGTPYRPTGPTGATGALAAMLDELDWLTGLVLGMADRALPLGPTPAEVAMRALSADALIASGDLVEGRSTRLPDRVALESARERVVDEMVARIDDAAVRDRDEALWSVLLSAWEVRVISYVVLDLGARAALAGGAPPGGGERAWLGFVRRQGVALTASGRLAAAHAGVRSIWFRNSLRGALGLALAVLIANEASVQHAFWVVLGSISVLRSNALDTGATIARALGGTLLGIVVGGLLLVLIGGDETALWIALPLAAMLAAYAPRAISFAAGQAGFSVAVLVIFNLLSPTGWEVGLIRLEDVSIGFAISLGVGLLLWPRGAGAVLRRALGDALSAGARSADDAFGQLTTGGPETAPAVEAAARAASDRLDLAVRQRLAERSGRGDRFAAHSRLVTATGRLVRTAEAMRYLARRLDRAPRPREAGQLLDDARQVAAWYEALGRSVARRRSPPAAVRGDPALRPAMLTAIRHAHATHSRDRLVGATAILWGALHLEQLEHLAGECAKAAAGLE